MVEFCHLIGQIYLLDLWSYLLDLWRPCVFVHAFLVVASGQVLYVSRAKRRAYVVSWSARIVSGPAGQRVQLSRGAMARVYVSSVFVHAFCVVARDICCTYHAQGVARKSFARASYHRLYRLRNRVTESIQSMVVSGKPEPVGHRVQLSHGRIHGVYVPSASAWHKYLIPCRVGISPSLAFPQWNERTTWHGLS